MTAIVLDQVSLGWRDRVALRDISGLFSTGSLTAVVGPNGAGKSTLIKGIMGQVSPVHGHIRISGEGDTRDHIACLPQAGELDCSFPISVYDLVAMGAWRRVGPWRGFSGKDHDRVQAALDAVGLGDFGARIIGTLSGGQLQRALFARLMMHDAKILLLDEPFAAVDRHTTDDLLALMQGWHQQGRTLIAVLHDLDMVRAHFPQTLLLARQVVAWGPTEQVLTPENLHLARHLCAGDFQ
ncbi:ABC transporter ATP-binding protein [Alcaligenaceae bacterium]|nr:ABC transporter ATP-binding protein [Alcaligenaceae bacterium]